MRRLTCAAVGGILLLLATLPADAWDGPGVHGPVRAPHAVVAPRTVVVTRPHAFIAPRPVVVAPRPVVVVPRHAFVGPRVIVGVGVASPFWWPTYAYPYPAYAYAPPATYALPSAPPQPAYWYYCQESG